MSYFPQPMYYGYPAPQASRVGPTARYAGILLLILGIIALLAGGCFTGFGVAWDRVVAMPEIQKNAEMQKMLSDMSKAGIHFSLMLIVFGVAIVVYSLTCIILAIFLLRATGKASSIVGIVLVGIMIVVLLFLTLLQLLGGGLASAGVWVVLLALHGLILVWLIKALQTPASVVNHMPPASYSPGYGQPMQGYQYPQSRDQNT